jgi:CYTH domain-containing protein
MYSAASATGCSWLGEMAREDEFVTLPPWVGQEVTTDARYRNTRLAAS